MKSIHIFFAIVVVALLAIDPVSGCHKRRKKRSIVQGSGIKAFFPSCLKNQLSGYRGYVNRDFRGTVSFALFQSLWYEETDTFNCVTDHTVKCWINSLPNFISGSSPLLRAAQRCVKAYFDHFYQMTTQDPYYPPGIARTNNPTCTAVNVTQYQSEFLASINATGLSVIDESVSDFNDVIEFARTDMICPTCSCDNLDRSDGDLDDYDFEDGKSCGACWTTRLATGVRTNSRFRRPAGRLAKRRGGLRRRPRKEQGGAQRRVEEQGYKQPYPGPRSGPQRPGPPPPGGRRPGQRPPPRHPPQWRNPHPGK